MSTLTFSKIVYIQVPRKIEFEDWLAIDYASF